MADPVSFPARGPGAHVGGKLSYRAELVKLWREQPTMTLAQARARTGAPHSVAIKVRRDLVARGELRGGPERWAC